MGAKLLVKLPHHFKYRSMNSAIPPRPISPEATAQWYFRLNGCLQIENFVLHPDPDCEPSENQARTDADLIGVRMPWRDGELGMKDDSQSFGDQNGKLLVYFAEVKAGGYCRLNGPWSKPTSGNIPRVLHAIGCFKTSVEIQRAADRLYEDCFFEDERLIVRMVAFGTRKNPVVENSTARALQITWDSALHFIHERFQSNQICKADHDQWPEIGQELWRLSKRGDAKRFTESVVSRFPRGRRRNLTATHSL